MKRLLFTSLLWLVECLVAEGVGTVSTCHRLLWEPDPVGVDVFGYHANNEDQVWSFVFAGPVGGLL